MKTGFEYKYILFQILYLCKMYTTTSYFFVLSLLEFLFCCSMIPKILFRAAFFTWFILCIFLLIRWMASLSSVKTRTLPTPNNCHSKRLRNISITEYSEILFRFGSHRPKETSVATVNRNSVLLSLYKCSCPEYNLRKLFQ